MSIKSFKFVLAIILSMIFFSAPVLAAEKDINVDVSVYFCNHDTVCDTSLGENSTFCADDCPPPPVCNHNGVCDNTEDVGNCPSDCTPTTTPPNNGGGGGGGGGSYTPPSSTTTTSTLVNTSTVEVTSTPILANPYFTASGRDAQVYLTWRKIDLADVWSKVIVRRSTLFYPENINSGGLLYDGLGKTIDGVNFFIYDTGLKNGKRYYYTIFVVGKNGEVSSGVSASALTVAKTTPSTTLEIPKIEIPPEITLPKSPNFQELNFNDLVFSTSSPSTTLLEIPADKVPSSTFAAILTLQDQNGYQSYILGTGANGIFANFPSAFSAEKQLTVTFLDRNHEVISQINGKIGGVTARVQSVPTIFQKLVSFLTDWRTLFGVILAIILLLLRFL